LAGTDPHKKWTKYRGPVKDDIVVRPQEAEVLTRAPVVLEIAVP
jgi:hypothetical protein